MLKCFLERDSQKEFLLFDVPLGWLGHNDPCELLCAPRDSDQRIFPLAVFIQAQALSLQFGCCYVCLLHSLV